MSDLETDTDQISAALAQLRSDTDAAENHGTLCGLLCAQGEPGATTWLKSLPGSGDADADQEASALVQALAARTLHQINDPTLDFHLLLPDDEQPLAQRAMALGEWCQGFLAGLSLGGLRDFTKLPEAAEEVAHDLAQIASAGRYEMEDSEEDEIAYSDLVEYVRMGVLLINEELHPAKDAPPTLH